MFRPAVLLRVLLSLALIFNGIGGAVASSRMQPEGAGHMHGKTQAVPAAQASQVPSCGEHAGLTAASKRDADSSAMKESVAESKDSADCCKSSACPCDCVQQLQVAIAAALFPAPIIEHTTSVRAVKPAHAAASLPRLIRPPIG